MHTDGVGNATQQRQCSLLQHRDATSCNAHAGGPQQCSGASSDYRAPEYAYAAPIDDSVSLQGPRAGQVASMFTDFEALFLRF